LSIHPTPKKISTTAFSFLEAPFLSQGSLVIAEHRRTHELATRGASSANPLLRKATPPQFLSIKPPNPTKSGSCVVFALRFAFRFT